MQLGLVVQERCVQDVIEGSPAYLSRSFRKGDLIAEVDGEIISSDDKFDIFDNHPSMGELVSITVADAGEVSVGLSDLSMSEFSSLCIFFFVPERFC